MNVSEELQLFYLGKKELMDMAWHYKKILQGHALLEVFNVNKDKKK